MGRVIGLELVKIGKRRLTWALLLLLIGSIAALLLGFYALIAGGKVPIEGADGREAAASALLPHFILPGVVPEALGMAQGLGGWLLVILTAVAVGMEEGYGTVRVMLGAGLGRTRYLTAKLGALLVVTVAFVAAALGVGVVSALIIAVAARTPITPLPVGGPAFVDSVGMALRTIGVLCFSVALTFGATVLSRSQVIGMAVGLGASLVDTVAAGVLPLLGAAGRSLSPIVPGRDIAAVMALNHFGPASIPLDLPTIPVAVLALLGYATLFIGGSWLVFRRRDITSGAG